MAQELYSVEQVAELLGLHVRTVRNYVRDGRLKAVRIGKQYRVAREDLEALTGKPVERTSGDRHLEVSATVYIDGIDETDANRVAVHVTGSLRGGHALRVDTSYDAGRARMRFVVLGDVAAAADVLRLISMLAEEAR
jgi:excisionase family DNA binding protein